MKRISAVLATTHVDRHDEAIATSALQQMVDLIRSSYLPMWDNHDPRIPPLGRVIDAELRELPDGEHAVEAEIELFEDGDEFPIELGNRRAIIPLHDAEQPAIGWDRAFAAREDQEVIGEICRILGAEEQEQGKKALEPIAVLTIAVSVAASNVASGFLQKIGADAWDALKPKLKSLFRRRRPTPAQLFCLALTTELAGERRLIEIILSDPDDQDIDSLSVNDIQSAVERAARELTANRELVRFVFMYSRATALTLEFAVASNGVPIAFAPRDRLRSDDREAEADR